MNLYFDNASTSFPKPSSVHNAIMNYGTNIGTNPGRGAYSLSLTSNRLVYSAREAIAEFFNFDNPENVIFTMNVTHALNILIKGLIKPNWHVITSSMEHNSVIRPLYTLKQSVDFDLEILPCTKDGLIDIETFKSSIKSNTKVVIFSHASNVIGNIQPLEEIGNICKSNNIFFIVDGAQSCGSIPVDFKALNCNALCFTGHKALLGPQGIGGFLIDNTLNSVTLPLYEGGTGSTSDSLYQPDFLPDKFESGTLNSYGIAGLSEGIKYINSIGTNTIFEKKKNLLLYFYEQIASMNNIISFPSNFSANNTGVISLKHLKLDPSEFSFYLANNYNIMTRSGLHCSPLTHKTIGSFPEGTVRFSLGFFNEKSDIDYVINSINSINKIL